jgi:hypothetical protein
MTREARLSPGTVSFLVGRKGGPKILVIDSQKLQKSDQQSQLLTISME